MSATVLQADNERDAHVVEEILGYITGSPARSFFLFAGAGSGKTRTLVEVLRRVTGIQEHPAGATYAERLRARGQSIRVITYTKNATSVVNGRLGENDYVAVSTIHAFCWELIAGFDEDIRDALLALNAIKLQDAKAKAAEKKRGETETDREKYAELEAEADGIRTATHFIYHPDKNTYGQGALHHAQVLDIAAWLIDARPTLRQIIEDRHPLILIDESQDTMKGLLDSLFALSTNREGKVTLGLLGDHRQRIYQHGHSDLPSHVPPQWARPALAMNHRSQRRIVDLINAIWEANLEGRTQPSTGVRQYARIEKSGGVVRVFVGDTRLSPDEKYRVEAECAKKMAEVSDPAAWTGSSGYQLLALEHKLAARRGGFLDVYLAMDLLDSDAASPQGNGESTGPSVARVLLGPMLELVRTVGPGGTFNESRVTEVLRRHDVLKTLPSDLEQRRGTLETIHTAVQRLAAACGNPVSTVRDVLAPIIDGGLFDQGSQLRHAFLDTSPPPEPPKVKSAELKADRQRRGWCALFESPWSQVALYRTYLSGKAKLATHQVVKGSEFQHVMVVMDDQDAGGFLFSYDKLLGGATLTKADRDNADQGKETGIDRTLRLLYVTCSRAEESLALMLWSADPAGALVFLSKCGWFTNDEIVQVGTA